MHKLACRANPGHDSNATRSRALPMQVPKYGSRVGPKALCATGRNIQAGRPHVELTGAPLVADNAKVPLLTACLLAQFHGKLLQ
jgi:hypothetical protein